MKHRCRVIGVGLAPAQYYYYDSRPEGAGVYSRLELGPAFFQDGQLTSFGGPPGGSVQYNTGFAVDAAVGYAFNPYIAADFEFGAIGAEIQSVPGYFSDNTYLDNLPFLANVTLSWPIPGTLLVPYIGAGAGGSLTVFGTDGFGNNAVAVYGNDSDVVWAWQAFAGLRVDLNPRLSLSLGYKYFVTGDPSFSYPPAYPYTGPNFPLSFQGVQAHCVLVGVNFKF